MEVMIENEKSKVSHFVQLRRGIISENVFIRNIG